MRKIIAVSPILISFPSIICRYNVRWYVAPLQVQKLILFLLQRRSKILSLNFGIIFALSLELFATVKVYPISISPTLCITYIYRMCE